MVRAAALRAGAFFGARFFDTVFLEAMRYHRSFETRVAPKSLAEARGALVPSPFRLDVAGSEAVNAPPAPEPPEGNVPNTSKEGLFGRTGGSETEQRTVCGGGGSGVPKRSAGR